MPEQEITQILLGNFRVGVAGLKEAIAKVKTMRPRPDEEIAQALLDELKPRNYIPASSREEYKKALLREFKKALGEEVIEERTRLNIKILGSGCAYCDRMEQAVMEALVELGLPAEVERIRDVAEITALGVFGVPALLINDEVKAVGQVPSKAALQQWLRESRPLEKQSSGGS